MIVEPKEFVYEPLPADEWLTAVVDKAPEVQKSKFDETKDVLVVLFRIDQDFELNGKNVRGQKIPRTFPVNWPNDKSKREPLLFSFVTAVAPELAVKNKSFDSDQLAGRTCKIMIEDQKTDTGGIFQKVVKWKAAGKTATPAPAKKVAVATPAQTDLDY